MPRLMYMRRSPGNSNSPDVYRRFFTGKSGGGRNGGLHCPPWVWPARIQLEVAPARGVRGVWVVAECDRGVCDRRRVLGLDVGRRPRVRPSR